MERNALQKLKDLDSQWGSQARISATGAALANIEIHRKLLKFNNEDH